MAGFYSINARLLDFSRCPYFDFYGYSLIAIGLGLFFGFRFPDNFLRPYEALNPREFWRRWHVTLSYWIRDYAYMPLGGNRVYARNILIVFALCGLWHGAGWTFVAWGLFHAALVIGYHNAHPAWDAMPAFLQRALTFMLVSFGWVLFLFDFAEIRAFGRSLAGMAVDPMAPPESGLWLALGLAALATYGLHFERMAERAETGIAVAWLRSAAAATLFIVTLFFLDRSQTFIYFRF